MKNIIKWVALLLFFIFQSCSLFSGTILFPIEIGKKYGYINYSGDLIIKPRFDRAYEFSEGLASVKINDECAYINEKGRIVSRIDADFADSYSEGLAFFLKNQLYGYIDLKGNIVIPAKFQYADPFSGSFACVSLDGKDFYINHDGENVFKKTFDECYSFNEGYAVVRILQNNVDGSLNKIRLIIDKNGDLVYKPVTFQIQGNKVSSGLIQGKQGNSYGYFNLEGEMVIDVGENYASDFSEGYAYIYEKSTDKYGMIDKHGNWIIKPIYEQLSYMSEGLIPFERDDKWGFIDIEGTVIIPNQFWSVLPFTNGMARVNPRDGYDGGYVNKEGKIYLGKDYINLPNTNQNIEAAE